MELKPEKYFDSVYSEYDRYMVIPVVLVLLAVGVLGVSKITTGEFVQKGNDFTGGTTVSYDLGSGVTSQQLQQAFSDAGWEAEVTGSSSGNSSSFTVELQTSDITQDEAENIIQDAGFSGEISQYRSISASVSETFFRQAQLAFLMAFTIMSLVIFVAFKDVVPSMAVILAATGDIIIAAAGMSLLGIPLTLGSLAALLMLIGYSVDTDIVLSTRVLKRTRGSLKSRIWSSVKTGVTMSSGGIAGFTLLYLVSIAIVGQSELSNIAGVMVIGLLADMPLTWFGNAIILKKYQEGDLDSIGGVLSWR